MRAAYPRLRLWATGLLFHSKVREGLFRHAETENSASPYFLSTMTKLEGRSESREAWRYLWHVFVTAALFSFLVLAAVGIEILLDVIRESRYGSEFLLQTLVFGKYAILIIDLVLLIFLLVNHTWTYARSLPWKQKEKS